MHQSLIRKPSLHSKDGHGTDTTLVSTLLRDSYKLTTIAEGNNPVVDIVAVHGLNGNSEKTWTASNNVNWLRDLLPVDIPNARIFTWGYDAKTHSPEHVSVQTVRDHAVGLISDLCREREETKTLKRPLIFVAHSLGGLVVKKALVHSSQCGASERTRYLHSIVTFTYGIMFMGTPHQGGNFVPMGKAAVTVVGFFIPATKKQLKFLERNSPWLQELTKDYTHIAQKFETIFFYEVYPTKIFRGGPQIRIVPQDSAVIPGLADVEPLGINKDHRGMVRFEYREDPDYVQVVYFLKKMKENAKWKKEEREKLGREDKTQGSFSVTFGIQGVVKAGCFVGRDQEIQEIHQKLQSKDERSVLVLHGLGGMGKTQLAYAYTCKHRNDYSAVFWLNSKDKDTLKQSFMDAAWRISNEPDSLFHFEPILQDGEFEQADDESNDQTGKQIKDRTVRNVKAWLSKRGNTRWLLIFENYDNPLDSGNSDKKDPDAFSIMDFFPEADHGSILITSRSASLDFGHQMPVRKLRNDKDCLHILSDVSRRHNLEQDRDALELVKRLDGLPLALNVAGAYLRQVPDTCGEYLENYQKRWSRLQEISPGLTTYKKTLYSTWDLSLDYVKRRNPHSEMLLRLWAFFDNQDLWFELLEAGREHSQPEWFHQITSNNVEFGHAMGALCAHSLAEGNNSDPQSDPPPETGRCGYSMHACVHEWTKNVLNECGQCGPDRELSKLALSSLGHYLRPSGTHKNWRKRPRVAKHIHECLKMVRNISPETDDLSMSFGFNAFGSFYQDEGEFVEAEALYQRALQAREKILGSDHEMTLNSLNNLSNVYEKQMNWDRAEDILKRASRDSEEGLGPEHPTALTIAKNLGSLLRRRGKLAEAEPLLQRALQGRQAVLGKDSPFTMLAMTDVGFLFAAQKKFPEAEELYRQVWQGYERVLGADHPWTLPAACRLGLFYIDRGKLADAEETFHRALSQSESIHGANSESTLAVLGDIGYLYEKQERLDDAAEISKRVLNGYEHLLGPDHQKTLSAVIYLGYLYSIQRPQADADKQPETFDKARRLFQRALEGFERSLGAEAEPTLNAAKRLGATYAVLGMLDKAEKLLQRTLHGHDNVLGPEHENTIWTARRLCEVYERQGKPMQAEELRKRVSEHESQANYNFMRETLGLGPREQKLLTWR